MRKPSDADLRSALSVSHFGSDSGPLPASDPIAPTAMVLAIRQIESYEHNPRRAPNAKFDELKESIRLNGLRQPLVITRRPGAANYMPKHGGNTRLLILKELLAETGDLRFATANCLFEPWSTESDVLVGHLIENEMRDDLVFIDKARAIREVRLLIEQETGTKLTQRQLAEALRARGYRLAQPNISHYEYAVDTLLEAIPKAMAAGLGKPKVERLREIDRAAQAVWLKRGLGPDELYRSIFIEALARVDTEHWDSDRARQSLEQALATRAGAEPRHISLELGGELEDTREDDDLDARIRAAQQSAPLEELATPTLNPAPPSPSPVGSTPISSGIAAPSQFSETRSVAPPPRSSAGTPPARRIPPPRGASPSPGSRLPETEPAPSSHSGPESEPEPQDSAPMQLADLRRALRDSALEYARHSELAYCLRFEGSPWIRLGYIVADFPAPAQMQQLQHDIAGRAMLAWKWYELTRCCDLLSIADHVERLYGHDPDAKQRVFAELFGSNPRYLGAWASPDACLDAIAEAVGILDLQQFAFYAERIGDETWEAGIRLAQAYRDLKSYAYQEGIDLMQDELGSLEP
ncbi:MAG: hypothetical protein OSA97_05565 [Nevskia sp.]|nr:hypothetical protein [Nevskia sp.]